MKVFRPKEERQSQFSQSNVAESIRKKIDKNLPAAKNMDDLKKLLLKDGVKMYVGRGVSFLDKESGTSFKGSALGREYSLMNLEKSMSSKKRMNSEKSINSAHLNLSVISRTPKVESSPTPETKAKSPQITGSTMPAAPTSGRPWKLDGEDEEEKERRRIRLLNLKTRRR